MRTNPTSILGFVSQIVSSLAWPVTLLTCVLLLKRHLLALIPLVRTVKYSDVEIHFGQEVAELKKTADIANMAAGPKQDQWESLIRLADVKPRTAIRSAWGHIETSIRELAKKKNTDITDAAENMPMVIGALLLNQGAIAADQYVLMQKLRILLHEAERAEPDSITSASAAEYVTLALRLAASIIEKDS
jgi:hypothetical protein